MKNNTLLIFCILLLPKFTLAQSIFVYDNTERLTRVNYSPECYFADYSYDQDGNRITVSEKYLILNEVVLSQVCPRDSARITLNPTSTGLTFLWSTGDTTSSLFNVPPGNYNLTITETATGNRCTRDYTIQPSFSGLATINSYSVSCHGRTDGSAAVTIQGGYGAYKYLWSNGASSDSIANLSAGNYFVDVTDTIFNCLQHIDFTITEPGTFLSGFISSNPTCFGYSDGMAMINVIGNPNNYTYLWSNGGTMQFIINLPDTTYTVTVTDLNGCSMNDTIVLQQPSQLSLTAITTNVCDSASNGTIQAQTSGGTPAYQYSLDGLNYFSNPLFSSLPAGNYVSYTKDANGCIDSANCAISNHNSINNLTVLLSNDTLLTSPYASPNSWYLVGNSLPIGNASSYTCTNFGQYYVIGLDSNQCQAISDTIPACIVLEVNTAISSNGISTYPNPSSDETVIEFATYIKGMVSIRLLDLTGKTILFKEEKQASGRTILLKHHELPTGTYLLEVLNSETKYYSKIIVQ